MLCVVSVTADLPEVSLEGLLTQRRVLLSEERCLVGTQRAQVLRTNRNLLRYRFEAYADQRLSVLGGVERVTFLRRYKRLQLLLVVAATRWVPNSIF